MPSAYSIDQRIVRAGSADRRTYFDNRSVASTNRIGRLELVAADDNVARAENLRPKPRRDVGLEKHCGVLIVKEAVVFNEPIGAFTQHTSRAILMKISVAYDLIMRAVSAVEEDGVIWDKRGELLSEVQRDLTLFVICRGQL